MLNGLSCSECLYLLAPEQQSTSVVVAMEKARAKYISRFRSVDRTFERVLFITSRSTTNSLD
jgi:hypothetical protein